MTRRPLALIALGVLVIAAGTRTPAQSTAGGTSNGEWPSVAR